MYNMLHIWLINFAINTLPQTLEALEILLHGVYEAVFT